MYVKQQGDQNFKDMQVETFITINDKHSRNIIHKLKPILIKKVNLDIILKMV